MCAQSGGHDQLGEKRGRWGWGLVRSGGQGVCVVGGHEHLAGGGEGAVEVRDAGLVGWGGLRW